MHILIINFQLNGINRDQYEAVCNEVAEAFAAVPGLVSKKWLANEEDNTYGGVYLFENRQAMLDYQASELYRGLGSNPAFANITVTDFEMIPGPSKVTGVG
ncbi:MAG: YdhR family protein [Phycisphaerales bacterium]|nr:YdhR family protein [Phycisphaerales bacterium]